MWDSLDVLWILASFVLIAWVCWRGYGAVFDVKRGNSRVRGRAAMRVAAIGGLWFGALLLLLLMQRTLTGK